MHEYREIDGKPVNETRAGTVSGAVWLLFFVVGMVLMIWTTEWRWGVSGFIIGMPAGYLVYEILRWMDRP